MQAEAPLGAWIESFRTLMTWKVEDVVARALSTIRLRDALVVCDLTVKHALAAGATVAIPGGDDYREPQALADALQGQTDGVRYRVRHDLSGEMVGICVVRRCGYCHALGRAAAGEDRRDPRDADRRRTQRVRIPRPACADVTRGTVLGLSGREDG